MNSIILIAACAVCLDQLFFRGRLASYVVDNLKGPKKKHTVVQPPIGEDGELAEPKAPAGARPPLPALPARAELRDAEVHAMLGELDFGESAVMGDATAEERQAIANFDIRAYA